MFKELFSALQQSGYERLRNVLLGSYIIFWTTFNWRVPLILFWGDSTIEQRFDLMRVHAHHLVVAFGVPALLAGLYSLGMPWLLLFIDRKRELPVYTAKREKLERESKLTASRVKLIQLDIEKEQKRERMKLEFERERKDFEFEFRERELQVEVRRKQAEFDEENRNLRSENMRLKGELNRVEAKCDDLKTQVSKLESENQKIIRLEDQLEKVKRQLEQEEATNRNLARESSALQSQASAREERVKALQEINASQKKKIDEQESEIKRLRK